MGRAGGRPGGLREELTPVGTPSVPLGARKPPRAARCVAGRALQREAEVSALRAANWLNKEWQGGFFKENRVELEKKAGKDDVTA